MKHTSIHDIGARAHVVPAVSRRAIRRARLERFAALLEAHDAEVQLLSRIEYISKSQREALRAGDSPLAVAYRDPLFRAEGLASDQLGAAMRFFDLTSGEAHRLLCDCSYDARSIASRRVAQRACTIASEQTVGERWRQLCDGAALLWRRWSPA